jgi:hypothetical protein
MSRKQNMNKQEAQMLADEIRQEFPQFFVSIIPAQYGDDEKERVWVDISPDGKTWKRCISSMVLLRSEMEFWRNVFSGPSAEQLREDEIKAAWQELQAVPSYVARSKVGE